MWGSQCYSIVFSALQRHAIVYSWQRVNQRTAENSGRRARYTCAMHQNNHRSVDGSVEEEDKWEKRERREKERRKIAGIYVTYKHTRTRRAQHAHISEEVEKERERKREREKEREIERTASSSNSSSSNRHGHRSRNRGTTTPVETLLVCSLRLRANYDALLGAGNAVAKRTANEIESAGLDREFYDLILPTLVFTTRTSASAEKVCFAERCREEKKATRSQNAVYA